MPAPQLLSATLSRALNTLLRLDADSADRLRPLRGKRLVVRLTELPWPLVFAFDNEVEVLTPQLEQDVAGDCVITLSVRALDALRDTANLTRLIKDGELTLDGDIQVAQSFSEALKTLDIDWEEQISRYTGDIFAHTLATGVRQAKDGISAFIAKARVTLSEGATEEKQIAAHPVAVKTFCDSVDALRSDVARLEARLTRLQHRD